MNHLAPLGWLASKVLARRYAALLRDQTEPLAAQQRAYAALRRRLAGTEIARVSGLGDAPDLAAFARAVPVRSYDFFAERVERVADRCEDGVLFHGRPAFIGLSSGTTGSNNKRILHNRATLAAFQSWEFSLGAVILKAGVNPLVSDRLVWGAMPLSMTRAACGAEQGYLSGFLATRSRALLRARTVPSPAVGRLADMQQKIRAAASEVRGRQVRIASAVPSYLIHLLEGLCAEWGVTDLGAVWPKLDLVLYSGTAIDCYRAPLRALLGRDPRYLGMYLATEAPLGYEIPALNGDRNGRYSFHLGEVVFTFRRLDGDDRVLTVGDLRPGDEVELLLTADNGLVNYRVGDCLKIHSVRPLLFEILGRVGHGLNIATEKVTLSQLARAVARVATTTPIRHYFVCPGTAAPGPPTYDFTLLCNQPAAQDPTALAAALDAALKEENGDYRENREDLGFLGPPRVRVLDAALARRYFERDAHRGQLKMKTAFDSAAALDTFLRELGAEPAP